MDSIWPTTKLCQNGHVRTLLVVAIQKWWQIVHLDINHVFLHGDLHKEVYMTIPKGYTHSLPSNIMFKLNKSIYGLK